MIKKNFYQKGKENIYLTHSIKKKLPQNLTIPIGMTTI